MRCCLLDHLLLAQSTQARTYCYLKPTLKSWMFPPANLEAGVTHLNLGVQTMKYFVSLLIGTLALVGCGAGHANLTSITVSPQSATTTSSPQGQVGYTATGNFQNGKSRELSQVDGLSWKTSPTSTGTVAATIGSTGEATCSAPGSVTVTASAPQNLQFTISNGVQNTSATVTGTAALICQ
jgi:hypothetical protein